MIILIIIFDFFKALILVDFVSGIGHWLEDRYGKDDGSWLGENIVKSNIEHHKTPTSFLARTFWYRNKQMIFLSLWIGFVLVIGGLNFTTNFFAMILLANINEIHAYAHRKNSEIPKLIRWCQSIGLLQSKKHHYLHHSSPHEFRYCILTNWLNPILDYLKFFRFLEYIILKVFKAYPNS